jgi:hypothetical protein
MTGMSRSARLGFSVLALAAGANLVAGVANSLADPWRATDLLTVYDWCRRWLIDGQSLYTAADAATDYPPNAIVLLAPLALVPARWLVPLWTAGAVALTPVLPWIVARAAAGRDRDARTVAVAVLAYLCWAAPRTLLQFSLLSLTLACVALVIADRRSVAGGVALGLALCKPHLAGPIALWMLVTGRIRPLAVASAVVLAGWAVYDARIGERPLTTAAAYWHVLGSQYAGPEGLVGLTSLRGLTRLAITDSARADAIWIALSVLLLAVLCILAARDRSRALDRGGLALPAMFCLWSLLVTYHNGNNMMLMLPAVAFLWFHGDARSARHWIPIAALQAALIYDVPVRLAGAAPGPGWGRVAIAQFDRVVVLTTLAYVCVLWYRLTATPAAVRAAPSPR